MLPARGCELLNILQAADGVEIEIGVANFDTLAVFTFKLGNELGFAAQ